MLFKRKPLTEPSSRAPFPFASPFPPPSRSASTSFLLSSSSSSSTFSPTPLPVLFLACLFFSSRYFIPSFLLFPFSLPTPAFQPALQPLSILRDSVAITHASPVHSFRTL
ncbi:uncharacterized protein BJX67DRAFT_41045 [Aspergillus lucknowensis]|uniref:Transmembrane protein n=1 Tax=Aspergillus lucknowensis TaxID=176173 RepID=A0ABR4LYQ0_9EURO